MPLGEVSSTASSRSRGAAGRLNDLVAAISRKLRWAGSAAPRARRARCRSKAADGIERPVSASARPRQSAVKRAMSGSMSETALAVDAGASAISRPWLRSRGSRRPPWARGPSNPRRRRPAPRRRKLSWEAKPSAPRAARSEPIAPRPAAHAPCGDILAVNLVVHADLVRAREWYGAAVGLPLGQGNPGVHTGNETLFGDDRLDSR